MTGVESPGNRSNSRFASSDVLAITLKKDRGNSFMSAVTVAEYLALFLKKHNVPVAFQLSGGMIAFLTDSIHGLGATPLIHNRHEQAAGFAAEGATRVTGIPSVAMGTSGPGATNLVTAIASCFYDSVPAVFITGQVRTDELKKNAAQRQNGFQELDICAVANPITKKTWRITNSAEVPIVLKEAWRLATAGRPGPVLIDLPIDIQQQSLDSNSLLDETNSTIEIEDMDPQFATKVEQTLDLLKKAKNPLVLVGGGVRTAQATELLHKFLEASNLPYVATLMGLDSVIHESENYLGFIGSYGNRWSNEAFMNADVLLVLGSRLDVRQTGPDIESFKRNKSIIRVDIDEQELAGRVGTEISIKANLRNFLEKIQLHDLCFKDPEIKEFARRNKMDHPQNQEQISHLPINPNDVMAQISETFRDSNGYVVDVGQHQMWAAQSLFIKAGQRFLTSGGLGAMGFALPAAIGAAFSKSGEWVVIIGDGCIQLSIQELQTISQYRLPLTICIINNEQHGMVAQFQEENMDSRYIGTRDGFSNPEFAKIASAFSIENYLLIDNPEDLAKLSNLKAGFKQGPSIIEFKINNSAKALPKMKFKKD